MAASSELSPKGLGLALGLITAAGLLFMSLMSAYVGWGNELVSLVAGVYIGYGEGLGRGLVGVVWGFADGFVGGWVLAWLYNKLS